MEIFWTVISGVSIFVLGQIMQNFILKPIQDFRRVRAEISHKIKFHANIITNSGLSKKLILRSSGDMRDLSCQLEATYLSIPLNEFFSRIKILPKRKSVWEASGDLIRLSNAGGTSGHEIANSKAVDKIKESLGIVL